MAPTQEERIAALEQITKEHHSVLRSLTYDMTAIQEFAFDQSNILQKVSDDLNFVKKDTHDSFQQLVEYHIRTENQIDARFNQVEARLDKIEANMATKDDIANMATKDDMVAMENRILHAVQQLITVVSMQLPQSE